MNGNRSRIKLTIIVNAARQMLAIKINARLAKDYNNWRYYPCIVKYCQIPPYCAVISQSAFKRFKLLYQ